jgi:hypothetical protein
MLVDARTLLGLLAGGPACAIIFTLGGVDLLAAVSMFFVLILLWNCAFTRRRSQLQKLAVQAFLGEIRVVPLVVAEFLCLLSVVVRAARLLMFSVVALLGRCAFAERRSLKTVFLVFPVFSMFSERLRSVSICVGRLPVFNFRPSAWVDLLVRNVELLLRSVQSACYSVLVFLYGCVAGVCDRVATRYRFAKELFGCVCCMMSRECSMVGAAVKHWQQLRSAESAEAQLGRTQTALQELDREGDIQVVLEEVGSVLRELRCRDTERAGYRVAGHQVEELRSLMDKLESMVADLQRLQSRPAGAEPDQSVVDGHSDRYAVDGKHRQRVSESGFVSLVRERVRPSDKFVTAVISAHARAGEYQAAIRVYTMAMTAGVDCAGNAFIQSALRAALVWAPD